MDQLPITTFDDLKKISKSFLDKLDGASVDSIENGWKMFTLTYLNTQMDERERESEGPALFRVIYRAYVTAMVPKL